VILALFTGAAVSAAAVPETAYGHIATSEQVNPAEIVTVKSVATTVAPKKSVQKKVVDEKPYVSASIGLKTSEPTSNTESIVRDYFSDIPVMIQVARCESGFRHTLSDGSTLQGRVDSADTGVMQINKRYHLKSASAMNLNLDNIYDNMAYARHLYETQGIQPWNASAHCWR
jgi:hypothetical protein